MRRLLTTLAALLIAAVAVAEDSDNKVIMKAVKSNMNFTEVSVGAAIKLYIEDRTEGNIIIRATERIMPDITLTVKDGELTISYNKELQFKSNLSYPIAEVYMPTNGRIDSFTAVAAASIDVAPKVVVKELDIEAVGASRINISAVADSVDIEAIGASNVTLDAECASVDCESTGASTVTLKGKATKADIEIIGASTFKGGDMECSQLDAEVGGASKATLSAQMANLEVYGASSVAIDCALQLNASASGASSIRYEGDCQINIKNSSGASSIKKQ
ncbi:MAG: DUF2807 domain-containing protein [Alistipes sp.]|nr:DUF2807 domain-containing protein [Alistipes sp.]